MDEKTSLTMDVVDRHGASLVLLAQVLCEDPQWAETEVAAVLAATHQAQAGRLWSEPSLRELGASVYRQCGSAWPRSIGVPSVGAEDRSGPLTGLPEGARVSLALCVYGGQSYTSAAGLLRVAPEVVADELSTGLRHLAAASA